MLDAGCLVSDDRSHRPGKLDITECFVIVIIRSVHSAKTYEPNRYILERVKYEVLKRKNEFQSIETIE
jgi:molybdopterin synthase catalytic subunit